MRNMGLNTSKPQPLAKHQIAVSYIRLIIQKKEMLFG